MVCNPYVLNKGQNIHIISPSKIIRHRITVSSWQEWQRRKLSHRYGVTHWTIRCIWYLFKGASQLTAVIVNCTDNKDRVKNNDIVFVTGSKHSYKLVEVIFS